MRPGATPTFGRHEALTQKHTIFMICPAEGLVVAYEIPARARD